MSLFVVVGAVLTMSCELLTGPYTGTYVGTMTASGASVRIKVDGSRVSRFETSGRTLDVGAGIFTCPLSDIRITNIPISGDSFSGSFKDFAEGTNFTIKVEGQFGSTDSVTGKVTATGRGGFCAGTASDTFTANR